MFSYVIGPLPFCLPPATAGLGPGTPFPLEIESLDALCELVWRVKTWRCVITGLSNEFASYEDYFFEFANHEKTGFPPPTAVTDLIAGYGLDITHEYEVLDNFALPNTFRLRLQGLDTGRHSAEPTRYYPGLVVELRLLLPGEVPPEEPALYSIAGEIPAGTLQVNALATQLYSGLPGQITDTWQGNITLIPLEEWDFAG
jgi:hypothetical protein